MSKRLHVRNAEGFPCIINNRSFQFVESYNSLRTNLSFASIDNKFSRIMITSSVSGEGKSTISINLAASLGSDDHKVLLMDCDLRKPMLHKLLRIDRLNPGLTNTLMDNEKIENCIVRISNLNIDFLASGAIPPNPVKLLGSAKMEQLIALLHEKYDYILFDTPPVSIVTDAAVLSKLSDGVIFVVRQNFTKIEAAQQAKNALEQVGANVIGAVLNCYHSKNSSNNYAMYYEKQSNS